MHVIFVSQCRKKAIKKTATVLDQYAMRIGDRTWMSPMTLEGLQEVHKALRQQATRQTAVSCFQNDGRKCMQLVWVVGSRMAFHADGVVSIGFTAKHRKREITPWARHVCLLAQASGLVHDFGKFSQYFQGKLAAKQIIKDHVRHEWLSVCLVRSLREGGSWEAAWQEAAKSFSELRLGHRLITARKEKLAMCTVWETIDFIVASHHKFFGDGWGKQSWDKKSGHSGHPSLYLSHLNLIEGVELDPAYTMSKALFPQKIWDTYSKLEAKLSIPANCKENFLSHYWWACGLIARAALIFADHSVSARIYSQSSEEPDALAHTRKQGDFTHSKDQVAFANTVGIEAHKIILNQPLVWHLQQVSQLAAQTAWQMVQLVENPHDLSKYGLDGLQEASLQAVLEPAEENSRYQWQNVVASALSNWREVNGKAPCLLLNMASTGSGKTRMNLRAACILANSARPRISVALNLRTLTLQTGDAIGSISGIWAEDIVTIIGDKVTQALHGYSNLSKDDESTEPEFLTRGTANPLPAWMVNFASAQEKNIMATAILVSTIDFLEAAGNPNAQGHHVKALLRIMTADLVLDEIDSYEPESLVAVLRLVQLSAFFQRNVICSSATLSQPVAEAIHAAWHSGICMRQALQGDENLPAYGIAMIDDGISPLIYNQNDSNSSFKNIYADRITELVSSIQQTILRQAFLQPVTASTMGFKEAVVQAVERLHCENAWQYAASEKSISFGLVRVANINTAIILARHLATSLPQAQVACYHANDWRISRFHKERRLDFLLNRKNNNLHLEKDAEIHDLINKNSSKSIPFIVVATPVEEIGRDHDFDWAVIEPSSAQSIVQTAGRVNRHRVLPLQNEHNVAILQYNYRHCKNTEQDTEQKKVYKPAFVYPGYELQQCDEGDENCFKRYGQHDLRLLLPWPENGENLVISSALRLGQGSVFAKADDAAINARVKRYFGLKSEQSPINTMNAEAEELAGLFTRDNIDRYLISATPYKKTPLRAVSALKQVWRMHCQDEHPIFEQLEFTDKKAHWVMNSRDMIYREAVPNAWLALTPLQMESLCHEAGIAVEDGCVVELLTYNGNEIYEYDEGFGVHIVK